MDAAPAKGPRKSSKITPRLPSATEAGTVAGASYRDRDDPYLQGSVTTRHNEGEPTLSSTQEAYGGVDVSKRCLSLAVRPAGERFGVPNDDVSVGALVARLKEAPALMGCW
jgi:hypothetical protein